MILVGVLVVVLVAVLVAVLDVIVRARRRRRYEAQFNELAAQFQAAQRTIGEELLPVMRELAAKINEAVDRYTRTLDGG